MDGRRLARDQFQEPPVSIEDRELSLQMMRSIFGDEETKNSFPFSMNHRHFEAMFENALLLVCWFANPNRQRKLSEVCKLGKYRDPSEADPIMLGCMVVHPTSMFTVFERMNYVSRYNQLLRMMICPIPIKRCLGLLPDDTSLECDYLRLFCANYDELCDIPNSVGVYKNKEMEGEANGQALGFLHGGGHDALMRHAGTRLYISRQMQLYASKRVVIGALAFTSALLPLTHENLEMLRTCPTFYANPASLPDLR